MKNKINVAIIGLGQIGNFLYNEISLKKKDIELKNLWKSFEELNKKNLEITSSNIDNVVFENLNYFKINNDIGQNTISGIEY